jgi:hypothetical protein
MIGQLGCHSGIERQVGGAKKFLLNLKHVRIQQCINPVCVSRQVGRLNHFTGIAAWRLGFAARSSSQIHNLPERPFADGAIGTAEPPCAVRGAGA